MPNDVCEATLAEPPVQVEQNRKTGRTKDTRERDPAHTRQTASTSGTRGGRECRCGSCRSQATSARGAKRSTGSVHRNKKKEGRERRGRHIIPDGQQARAELEAVECAAVVLVEEVERVLVLLHLLLRDARLVAHEDLVLDGVDGPGAEVVGRVQEHIELLNSVL